MISTQKIVEMLSSKDIDMVRLGVELMKKVVISEAEWELFLRHYCNQFIWRINSSEITIVDRRPFIWEQLQGDYKYCYSPNHFSLETVTSAINEYFNKKQDNE